METRANYVAVGAFVMICMLGLVIAALWLAGAQYRQEYAYFRTYFAGPVTGLGRGTIVRYNGIDFGHVSDLGIDPSDPKRVEVTLEVDPTVKLHVDSVASLETQGITGGVYVEIEGGSANSALLEAKPGEGYPVIQSKASTLQQLTQAGPEIVGHINAIGAKVEDVLNDKNREAISQLLKNLQDTTTVINQHSADLEATLANMRTATGGIAKTLTNVDQTLTNADHALSAVDQTLGSLQQTANTTTATVEKIGKLSDDADKVVNGPATGQLTQLLAETRSLVTSLNRLSNDIQRDPSRLIYGDQRQGYVPK